MQDDDVFWRKPIVGPCGCSIAVLVAGNLPWILVWVAIMDFFNMVLLSYASMGVMCMLRC